MALARRRGVRRITAGDFLGGEVDFLGDEVDGALSRYDFRHACRAIVAVAADANRFIEASAPWKLDIRGDRDAASRFDDVIDHVLAVCATVAEALEPFVPAGARRLRHQLASGEARPAAFPRL